MDQQKGQSSAATCVFNLVASMVGGGILSLPYCLAKAGLLGGLIVTVAAGLASGFSMHLLMCCAERTQSATYFAVASACFGWWGGLATTVTIFIEMLLVPVAYMVLLRDIMSSVLQLALQTTFSRPEENWVLGILVFALLPLFLQRSLHALRHTCVIGVAGTVILGGCLLYKAVERNDNDPQRIAEQVRLDPERFTDALLVFPIITLAFKCQINTVSVHGDLRNPTAERCKQVVMLSCCTAAFLYCLVALAGYLCAYGATQDDIFLNFPSGDRVMLVGKLWLGATLLAALPVNFLPIRDSAFGLWTLFRLHWQGKDRPLRQQYQGINQEEDGLMAWDNYSSVNSRGLPEVPSLSRHNSMIPKHSGMSPGYEDSHGDTLQQVAHVAVTLALLAIILWIALVVPGVAIVWELCGSTVAMFIAFVLPAAFYLKLSKGEQHNNNIFWSKVLLVAGLVAACLCTWVTIFIPAKASGAN